MATSYASARYFHEPQRQGTALCLSGGGFRAALFHLGAARRLYELGVLQRLKTITAVSGGATIAAHLAEHIDDWCDGAPDTTRWETKIAVPFREVTSASWNAWPWVKGWLLGANAGVEAMAARCANAITHRWLHELPPPPRPQFVFGATDLVSGDPWIFERTMPSKFPVALAVAVSSCFPVLFRPYKPRTPQRLELVDGGLDDNRGLEPVWRTHETLLVSDGGDALRPEAASSMFWSWFRSVAIIWNESQEVQKRWLLSGFDTSQLHGAYWGVGSSVWHYQDVREPETLYPGYSPALARDVIALIRTDYDGFSPEEAAVLENHGYLLTDAATRTHLPNMVSQQARPPLRIPHPAWMREDQIREALADSWKKETLVERVLALAAPNATADTVHGGV